METCSFPDCQAEGPIVVLYVPTEVRSCDPHWPALYKHYLLGKKKSNANLGQTLEKWSHVDKKSGKTIEHKLSVGKNWEIVNRGLSKDDNKTAINKVTGKEAQY